MKIYYLKYYKGNIKVEEIDIAKSVYSGAYMSDEPIVIEGLEFHVEYEGEVLEYSLGDIRIWITEKGSLELAKDKLVKYVISFHEKNIRRLENNALEQRAWLQPLYSLRDNR